MAAGRVWPVTIDPSVLVHPHRDCHIASGTAKNDTYCSGSLLRVGWNASASMKRRALLRFDLSILPRFVDIQDAKLSLYLQNSSTSKGAG